MKISPPASDFRSRRGQSFVKVFVFILVLAATLTVLWVLLLPSLVTGLIKKRTGFDAAVESLYANPFTASINIHQLKIDNPDTFPQRNFVMVNEFKTAV